MYSSVQVAKKYLHYYLSASNSRGHGMHSPFVFDFICTVLNNKNKYAHPDGIEHLRNELLQDKSLLEFEDFGAGSRSGKSFKRTVGQLAKTSLKPKKYAQLLYRLVMHYQPAAIIELGTSLGITTAYLALSNPGASVITIEGSEAVAKKAKENFERLKLSNILSLHGNFDTLLPVVLTQLSTFNLAYIDGNHRYSPTINYFTQFLANKNDNSILVFDDIHWSLEMEQAWEEIKSHPSVQYTIDIFFLGFVFFKQEFREKQHFTIRF